MKKESQRHPKNYDGVHLTSRPLTSFLPAVLSRISGIHDVRGDRILAAWPTLVGEKLAPFTHAVSFVEGVLSVKVKNSTLYSLLTTHEKMRLLKDLRKQFPQTMIKTILFRLG